MTVNEMGNYECDMTLILVKKDILKKKSDPENKLPPNFPNYSKALFVLYTNTTNHMFNFEFQKIEKEEDDEQYNHYSIKDLQEKSGIMIVTLWNYYRKREDDEPILDENVENYSKVEEQKVETQNVEEKDTPEDFDEKTNYKEIVRIGLNIKPIEDEKNKISSSKELIEYLINISSEKKRINNNTQMIN